MGMVLRDRVGLGYGCPTGYWLVYYVGTCFSLEFTNEGKEEYKTHPRAALLGRVIKYSLVWVVRLIV